MGSFHGRLIPRLFQLGEPKVCSAIDRLSRIEAALAGKALPVPSGEVIASAFAGDRLSEILGDVAPHFAAHDVVYRCKGGAVAPDHDRVVLGMRIGIAA